VLFELDAAREALDAQVELGTNSATNAHRIAQVLPAVVAMVLHGLRGSLYEQGKVTLCGKTAKPKGSKTSSKRDKLPRLSRDAASSLSLAFFVGLRNVNKKTK